jgi:hypothetical protein
MHVVLLSAASIKTCHNASFPFINTPMEDVQLLIEPDTLVVRWGHSLPANLVQNGYVMMYVVFLG